VSRNGLPIRTDRKTDFVFDAIRSALRTGRRRKPADTLGLVRRAAVNGRSAHSNAPEYLLAGDRCRGPRPGTVMPRRRASRERSSRTIMPQKAPSEKSASASKSIDRTDSRSVFRRRPVRFTQKSTVRTLYSRISELPHTTEGNVTLRGREGGTRPRSGWATPTPGVGRVAAEGWVCCGLGLPRQGGPSRRHVGQVRTAEKSVLC
jgi:hypothetical protein